MSNVSLYRKYRSQNFSDLVGQEHVVRTLQNAITSDRIAHAFLFTGPRGTGKTSTARLLAKAICCEKGPATEPCNECDICVSITEGTSFDVLEMDAASESGVDDIRETIVEAVSYKPASARYRVFIIDEVHDLSAKAFDALLKTVEEPPEHVVFVLATTEYTKVPPTIRSRCQNFEFHRASLQNLVDRLAYVVEKEGSFAEPAALVAIAKMADGGYRDALTLLEQALITSDDGITLDKVYAQLGLIADESADAILLALKQGDVSKLIVTLSELTSLGRDPRSILDSLMHRSSDLTRAAYNVDMTGFDPTQAASLHEISAALTPAFLLDVRGKISQIHKEIRDVSLPRIWMEAELIRCVMTTQTVTVAPARVAPTAPVTAQVSVAPPTAVALPVPVQVEGPSASVALEISSDESEAAKQLFAHLLSLLPDRVPHKNKLLAARVTGASQTEIEIVLGRKMDVDWFTENPQRSGYLSKVLSDAGHPGWTFKISGPKVAKVAKEAPAVELELTGAALIDAVQDELKT
ncbi:MAG: DNA polymerase III subunit gamma/tau [Fimbriimonadaceae bacterium]